MRMLCLIQYLQNWCRFI